jgi:hypothetical protein
MDWEAATRRDYIREHGSVPYWEDLATPRSLRSEPELTKTGKKLAAKARESCAPIVDAFRRLPPKERVAQLDAFRSKIRRACANEKREVTPGHARYAVAIDRVQKELLAELKHAAEPPKPKKEQPRQKAETKQTRRRRRERRRP